MSSYIILLPQFFVITLLPPLEPVRRLDVALYYCYEIGMSKEALEAYIETELADRAASRQAA